MDEHFSNFGRSERMPERNEMSIFGVGINNHQNAVKATRSW
jgi:hypothetical protein